MEMLYQIKSQQEALDKDAEAPHKVDEAQSVSFLNWTPIFGS